MKTRILSLFLAGAILLSTGVTASAARVSGSAAPKPTTSREWAVTPVRGELSFDQIAPKVRANNLTVQSMEETLASMEAMDWDKAIGELEDAIDALEGTIADLKNSTGTAKTACENLAASIVGIQSALEPLQAAGIIKDIAALGSSIYNGLQLACLNATLASMEEQLKDLKDQKNDYISKTLPDTKRQIASSISQIIIGAESLYLTILSTQLQLEALADTKAAMERTVAEMELRYERGQISQLTLTQVKNGYNSLLANMGTLGVALTSMTSSLQALLGDSITGSIILAALPTITDQDIAALSFSEDLAKAKEASYNLYTAARTVEDAEEDMEKACRESGKNSYQYKMAQHTYESAVLSEKSAIQSFEISFRSLYDQLSPALAVCTAAENDLAYEARVYQAAQLKYQQGNLSANALADAKDTYEAAKRSYASSKIDLFTTWLNYQNAVKYGVVSSGS